MAVSNLTWGSNGSFAINVWFAQTENEGKLFQYLISARNPSLPAINDTSIFLPNQVSTSSAKTDNPGFTSCHIP